jgi:hypothetical protein
MNDNWLKEILSEVNEQVNKWPEWKRSDEVRKSLKLLNSKTKIATQQYPFISFLKIK